MTAHTDAPLRSGRTTRDTGASRPGRAARVLGAFRSVLLWIGSAIGLFCIILFAASLIFGVRPQIVISGSMEPEIPVGALVLVTDVPASEVEIGDVVTVHRLDGAGLVTHRVSAIEDKNGTVALTLKGDANTSADPQPYRVSTVGSVILSVPGLGFVARFLQGPAGIVTIGAIIALIALAYILPMPGSRRGSQTSEAEASGTLDAATVPSTRDIETVTELSGDSVVAATRNRAAGSGGHQVSAPGAAQDTDSVVAPESGGSASHDHHTGSSAPVSSAPDTLASVASEPVISTPAVSEAVSAPPSASEPSASKPDAATPDTSAPRTRAEARARARAGR